MDIFVKKVVVFATLFYSIENVLGQDDFELSSIYSDNMVLQMEPKSTQIWGYGSEMFAEIELTFDSQFFYTTVLPNMTWYIQLTPQQAGGPYDINITQTSIAKGPTQRIGLNNVMFGDVWLCIGEGNMQFYMNGIFNSTDEIARVKYYNDQIRYAVTSSGYECVEQEQNTYSWVTTDSSYTPSFSATCLLYGAEMAELRPGRPIGLILAAHPLTTIESWGSKRVIDQCGTTTFTDCDSDIINGATQSASWNGYIYPLTKMAIRGIIWNQGESNVGYNQDKYMCQLENIYNDYRATFFNGNIDVSNENGISFPFGIMQLGTMNSGRKDAWGSLRWLQTFNNGILPSEYYPEFFMATTYDLTDSDSPFGSSLSRDKQSAVKRLAQAAGALLYNETTILVGPYSLTAQRGAAGVVGLSFSSKVVVRGTGGFTYLSSQGEWIPAPNFLQISETKIGVAIPDDVTTLSYAWSPTVCEYKDCALYSDEGLPAQPWIWNVSPTYSTPLMAAEDRDSPQIFQLK